MVHNWINENKKYGFYMLGFFDKKRKSGISFQIEKPFEIDNIAGEVSARCFHSYPRNMFPKEWFFIEGYRTKEVNTNKELQELIDEIWEEWCKKHNRKYKPIFKMQSCTDR